MGLTNGEAYYNRTGSYLYISGSTCIEYQGTTIKGRTLIVVPKRGYYNRRPALAWLCDRYVRLA